MDTSAAIALLTEHPHHDGAMRAMREHGLPLVTRDRRAADTYRAVGAAVELLD